MKNLFCILSVCFLIGSFSKLPAQHNSRSGSDEYDNLDLPKKLARKYKRDAARLVLRLACKKEDLRYQDIDIRKDQINSIFEVLRNIYQKGEQAKSLSKCNIHTQPNPAIDRFVLIFDREVDWAAPLRNGISETDSYEFNELLDEYALVIDKHVQWNDTQDAITIRSKEPLNMAALSNEFYNIEGIEDIDLGQSDLKGNDIQLKRLSGGWEVTFLLRFGSYIDSEGQVHIWKYEVSDRGDVTLAAEDGPPVPDWMRCTLKKRNDI